MPNNTLELQLQPDMVNGSALEKAKLIIESRKELGSLYADVIQGATRAMTIDVSKAKPYLESIKDKGRTEIVQKENKASTFAIQVVLKWKGLYKDRLDGIYGTVGSNTYNAVKEFQRYSNIKVDGFAGPETVKKLIEAIPETATDNLAKNETNKGQSPINTPAAKLLKGTTLKEMMADIPPPVVKPAVQKERQPAVYGTPTAFRGIPVTAKGSIPIGQSEKKLANVPAAKAGEGPTTKEIKEEYQNSTLFIGDSLTMGYANGYTKLSEKMQGKSTRWMKTEFDKYIKNTTKLPKTIFILGGVNDLCDYAQQNYNQGKLVYTAEEMAEKIFSNLEAMKNAAEKKDSNTKVIIGTVLPFGTFIRKQKYRSQAEVTLSALTILNNKIKKTRPEQNIDFYSKYNDPANKGCLLPGLSADGIHPSKAYTEMQSMAFSKRKQDKSNYLALANN